MDPSSTSNLKQSIDEIYEYFNDPKLEVRKLAMELLAGLSLDQGDALSILNTHPQNYISPLLAKLSTDHPTVAALAWDAITNFACDKDIALFLIDNHLEYIMSALSSKTLIFTEASTKLLSNITKQCEARPAAMVELLPIIYSLYIAGTKHNPNCDYEFLASVLADITNIRLARAFFLEDFNRLTNLLPDLHSPSVLRRGGIAGVIKNCLFETDFHAAILEKEIEDDFIITTLCGRLLDSKCKLSNDEKEKLPVELQLLDKLQAEPDMIVRSIVVESLIILGSTREGRDTMRQKEIYPILREWHLLEEYDDMKALVEKLVELLIRDEEYIRK